MEFEGKTAIVTGGSSGIGAATVKMLVDRGAKVLAVGTNAQKLASFVEPLGGAAIAHVADIGEQDQAEGIVDAAIGHFGKLDLLVNNAGVGMLARAGDLDPADWRRTMAVNLDAVFWASRVALPHLIASKGCIINTASVSSLGANYAYTIYNVTKSAVVALTRCMAIDYAEQGVRVNAVSPGFVTTPMNANAPQSIIDAYVDRAPMKRAGKVEEIAEAILFLASPRASFVTGHNLVIDGGTTAYTGLPNLPALFAALQND